MHGDLQHLGRFLVKNFTRLSDDGEKHNRLQKCPFNELNQNYKKGTHVFAQK